MSAKRSWDVRREPVAAPVAAREARRREPLKERRKRARRIFFISLGVLASIVFVLLMYLVWQPFVRVSTVTAEGPYAEELQALTTSALSGTYAYVLPKNSIFIFPQSSIRSLILARYPSVAAVSISRSGFTSIHVKAVERAPAFLWCGASASESGSCFDADAEGLVFSEVPMVAAAAKIDTFTTTPMDAAPAPSIDPSLLRIYAPLEQEMNDDGTPIKAHVVGADRIPDALRFVKAMRALSVNIVSVEIREDEADLYTPHGTRITYILGNEEKAATLAASAFPTLNFEDGMLSYVDLRFDGKVYIKRNGEL